MKTPYVEPIASLTPESKAALESFLSFARASVEYASENIPDADQAELFGFGGIAEVREAAQAIAEFLAHPRHRDEGHAV
jgi:BioD-like phosphotransacetylase family protein